MEKVVFKVTNFSASPLSFVGVHTLVIPGLCKDAEFSFPEAVANSMIKRLKSYPHIKVVKVVADKNASKAATVTAQAETKKAAVTETKSASKTSSKE